ncbi:MAG: 4'-phosphopantetheinyl transferase [Vicinamibacterales bacterium]
MTWCAIDLTDTSSNAPALQAWARQTLPRAHDRRCREFAGGRWCAAQALTRLTNTPVSPHEIGMGPDGAPTWPDGTIGSIAHTRHRAAAITGLQSDWAGMGLDIEPVLTPASARTVAHRIASAADWKALRHAAMTDAEALTIAFCLKEALFKCLYPVVQRLFFLEDAEVARFWWLSGTPPTRERATGCATIRLLADLSPGVGAGRCFQASVGCEAGVVYALVSVASGQLVEQR